MIDYCPGDTFIHRMAPGIKIVSLLALLLASFLSSHPFVLLSIFVIVFVAAVDSCISLRELLKFSRTFVIFAALVAIMQSALYPIKEDLLISLLGIGFYNSGLIFGMGISFRILTMGFAVPVLVMTTKPSDLANSMKRALPAPIAFSVVIAFRFISVFNTELAKVRMSQESRGGGSKKVRSLAYSLSPLFYKAVQKADRLTLSMESRGFSP